MTFSWWAEGGALTLVEFHASPGTSQEGTPLSTVALGGTLQSLLAQSIQQSTGRVDVILTRREAEWSVDYDFHRKPSKAPWRHSSNSFPTFNEWKHNMREAPPLPGLERLLGTCQRLGLSLKTEPPGRTPPQAGMSLQGLPLDPQLAAVYTRLGKGIFATDVSGFVLFRVDDTTNELDSQNAWWREGYQKELAFPVLIFAGEPGLSSFYATVPSLADAQGLQPVVLIEAYMDTYAVPIASSVDRLFDTWARYLELLVLTPGFESEGETVLGFPFYVPHLLSRDTRLVELLAAGHFDPLLPPGDESIQRWKASILEGARTYT